jgi:hypothetical protein
LRRLDRVIEIADDQVRLEQSTDRDDGHWSILASDYRLRMGSKAASAVERSLRL